jgi:hypothetical protein
MLQSSLHLKLDVKDIMKRIFNNSKNTKSQYIHLISYYLKEDSFSPLLCIAHYGTWKNTLHGQEEAKTRATQLARESHGVDRQEYYIVPGKVWIVFPPDENAIGIEDVFTQYGQYMEGAAKELESRAKPSVLCKQMREQEQSGDGESSVEEGEEEEEEEEYDDKKTEEKNNDIMKEEKKDIVKEEKEREEVVKEEIHNDIKQIYDNEEGHHEHVYVPEEIGTIDIFPIVSCVYPLLTYEPLKYRYVALCFEGCASTMARALELRNELFHSSYEECVSVGIMVHASWHQLPMNALNSQSVKSTCDALTMLYSRIKH